MEYISGLCVFFGQICIKYCKYSTPLVIDITMDQFLLESVVIVLHALVQFFLVVHFIMWKVEAEGKKLYYGPRWNINFPTNLQTWQSTRENGKGWMQRCSPFWITCRVALRIYPLCRLTIPKSPKIFATS